MMKMDAFKNIDFIKPKQAKLKIELFSLLNKDVKYFNSRINCITKINQNLYQILQLIK